MTDYERELFLEVQNLKVRVKQLNEYADIVQRQAVHAIGALHAIRALDARGSNNAYVIADLAITAVAKIK